MKILLEVVVINEKMEMDNQFNNNYNHIIEYFHQKGNQIKLNIMFSWKQ